MKKKIRLNEVKQEINYIKSLLETIIIQEGGNQFSNLDITKIYYKDIDTVIQDFEDNILKPLTIKNYKLLGSQKKKEYSGDLDLQVDIQELIERGYGNTLIEILTTLYEKVKKIIGDKGEVRKLPTIITIQWKYKEDKYVQIDLMVGDIDYLDVYMSSGYLKNGNIDLTDIEEDYITEYKQVYRNVFLQNLLTQYFSKIYNENGFEYLDKYTVTFNGIYKTTKYRKIGRKTWKVKQKEKINKPLLEFISEMFKKKITKKDFITFENFIKWIQNNDFIMQDRTKLQMQVEDLQEYCEKNELLFPEELINKYLY